MSVSIGNMSNIGKEKLITSSSNGSPVWSFIPSAGKLNKSSTQFTNEIKELAQKAAQTTNEKEQAAISKQVLQLRAEYLSDVAPNRKQLYKQAQNAVKQQNGNAKCKGVGELSLLDYLKDGDGLGDKRTTLAGGGFLKCPMLTTGGYGAEIESQGTTVLRNTGAGWSYEMTPAEQAKKNEFYSIYWNTYHAAKAGGKTELAELPDYLEERPRFDWKA